MVRQLGPGGTERQVAELAKAIDPRRFTPHVAAVYTEGMRAEELRAANIPILEVPVYSLTDRSTLEGFRILRRYLRAHRIRLVHAFDAAMIGFATPVARFCGIPAVLTSQRCYRDLIAPKYHPLIRLSHRIADGVVANCEAMRAHLRSEYGVPDRKIRVCYNGIDGAVFHDRGRRRMPSLESASLVIGTVGVLRSEKRLPLLLDAFASILPLDSAMKLVIVGSGEELPHLERQAADLGIGNACLFQPAVSDVAAWFRSIDVYVLGSNSEAFSNSMLEAMACGCCPVASRVGGNPEMVIPGETGLLFASEDSIDLARQLETLIRNPALRASLAARAAAAVARFSLRAMAQRMEEIYLESCGESA